MIRVGIAGFGFMGWIHWLAYQKVPGIEVAAFATRDAAKRSGDWTSIQGNFGPAGEQVDVSGLRVYSDWRDLLQDRALDLIDICLPPAQHPQAVKAALAAGKHVFCEKPLALEAVLCDVLMKHSVESKRQLLVGQVLPYFPEYQFAARVVAEGRYGSPRGGHFRRVISRPKWIPDFFDAQTVGGPLIDLHVHDAHLIRMLFGMPQGLVSQGWFEGGSVKFCTTLFDFGADRAVSSSMGVVDQDGRPFTHGFELLLDRATVQFEYAALGDGDEMMPLKLLGENGEILRMSTAAAGPLQAFEAEISDVVKSLQTGKPAPALRGEFARDAIVLCEAQTRSIRESRYVSIEEAL